MCPLEQLELWPEMFPSAPVVELEYTTDLKSVAERLEGSTPSGHTTFPPYRAWCGTCRVENLDVLG
jgi:hypothetical protein